MPQKKAFQAQPQNKNVEKVYMINRKINAEYTKNPCFSTKKEHREVRNFYQTAKFHAAKCNLCE